MSPGADGDRPAAGRRGRREIVLGPRAEPLDDHTAPMPIPSWMIIDAARYAVGRRSYQVGVTADWLVDRWAELPEHARSIIRQDLEEEFRRDDAARRDERDYFPLGDECDRQSWERVRALWAEPAKAAGTS